jgi:hypothetical protein
MGDNKLTGTQENARQKCEEALRDLDYEPAQVYATLGVEEALRDLSATIRSAADTIARAYRH